MVLGVLEIIGRHLQETSDVREIGFRHTLQTFAFHETNRGVNDGFGCEAMETLFEAEDIASQVKRADLATTVRQKLVTPNRAFNHLIEVVYGLCLSENLGARRVSQLALTKFAMKARIFIWMRYSDLQT